MTRYAAAAVAVAVALALAGPERVTADDHPQTRRAGQLSGDVADLALRLSHADHAGIPGGCRACHADPDRTPERSHAGCARCHGEGRPPAMTACDGCHVPAEDGPRTPRMRALLSPVRAAFSHRRHRSRTGSSGCSSCHAGVAGAAGPELPHPDKQTCRACHDGERAFSVTGPACRRCHQRSASSQPRRVPPPARYRHGAHRRRGLEVDCLGCHGLDDAGRPRPAAAAHAPCSRSGCHQDDFSAREPTVCGACHRSIEPWRPLHADVRPPRRTEFGARFSHRLHLAEGGPAEARACRDCHVADDGGLHPARRHRGCRGDGCHTPEGGPEPALTACADCHERGLLPAHERRRRRPRWSVRARFDHAPHLAEDGEVEACERCHAGVRTADSLAAIAAPGKPRCAPCHDGDGAFALTGHACARCHSP